MSTVDISIFMAFARGANRISNAQYSTASSSYITKSEYLSTKNTERKNTKKKNLLKDGEHKNTTKNPQHSHFFRIFPATLTMKLSVQNARRHSNYTHCHAI